MQAVTLKGHKEGYEIILNSSASMDEIIQGLQELLTGLQASADSDGDATVFDCNTGSRLLDAEDKKKIEAIVAKFPNFSIHRIKSDVIRTDVALDIMNSRSTHKVGKVIRNGQVEKIKGDVLFFGNVHQGGKLCASGNIYVMGEVHGIVHAGYEDDTRAVIVGNLNDAQQVRIGDVVDIVADNGDNPLDNVIYVSDLHNLESTTVSKLAALRPKIFVRAGGF